MNGRKNRDMISQKRKIGTIRRLGGGAFSQENGEGKAVQLVEKMIAYARKSHASDIHIEPFDDMVRIRMRMDMTDVETVRISMEDLGFGEFYPATHQFWEETFSLA